MPAKATVLEQTSWARTLVQTFHPTPPQLFIEKNQPFDLPDWSRVTFGKGFSVEQGHFFATNSIAKEFADLAEAWKA